MERILEFETWSIDSSRHWPSRPRQRLRQSQQRQFSLVSAECRQTLQRGTISVSDQKTVSLLPYRGFTQSLPHQLAKIKFELILDSQLTIVKCNRNTAIELRFQECNVVQNSENTYNIERKIQTQDLDSMIPPSTTIAMDDGDDSPLLARTLRFRSIRVRWCSNRSPLITFDFSAPSLHFLNREKRH
ncbi:hypothetical protein CR513_34887, partial [Mucuna pruriens]